jgi:hypothetical protein
LLVLLYAKYASTAPILSVPYYSPSTSKAAAASGLAKIDIAPEHSSPSSRHRDPRKIDERRDIVRPADQRASPPLVANV